MKTFNRLTAHTLSFLLISSVLVGCGFQLRENSTKASIYPQNVNQSHSVHLTPIYLKITDDRSSESLIRPLQKQFTMLGFPTTTQLTTTPAHSVINIENLDFREYELVGVLTEVRVVIHADVSYNIYKDGEIKTHKQPIQIERSFQYNEASVSTDQQGKQVRKWLYEALATRITDQFVALTMQH